MAGLQRQVSVSAAQMSDQLLWCPKGKKAASLPSGRAAVGAGSGSQLRGARDLRGVRKRVGGQFLGTVLKEDSVAGE